MKPLFPFLCVLGLISYSSFAMDFNAEDGIPLEAICKRTIAKRTSDIIIADSTTSTLTNVERVPQISIVPKKEQLEKTTILIPINERFIAFDKKMLAQFGGLNEAIKKPLNHRIYLTQAQNDIPEMFADTKTIKKCARVENTFFIHVIDSYTDIVVPYYAKVTSDTLATICHIDANLPIEGFKNYPPALRKYIMDRAYRAVKTVPYACIQFPSNCRCISFHDNTQLAVVATDQEFQIWDPKTGNYTTLPKKACLGVTIFSEDGNHFITATVHQETPTQIIHIDIWDSITKEQMHTVEHPYKLKQFILTNTPESDALVIFDEYHYLTIYKIQKNASPTYVMSTRTNIKEFNNFVADNNRKYGNYKLSGQTLFNSCIDFAFCAQAIKNTTNKESLQKVRMTDFYQRLTAVEQNLIEQTIIQKTQKLIHIAEKQERNEKSIFRSFFG